MHSVTLKHLSVNTQKAHTHSCSGEVSRALLFSFQKALCYTLHMACLTTNQINNDQTRAANVLVNTSVPPYSSP